MHLQQLGVAKVKANYVKDYHLSIKSLRKALLFCKKMIYKRVRDWTLWQSLPVQNFDEYPPPPDLIPMFQLYLTFIVRSGVKKFDYFKT